MQDVEAWNVVAVEGGEGAQDTVEASARNHFDDRCMLAFLHSDVANFRLWLVECAIRALLVNCSLCLVEIVMSYFFIPVLHHGGKLERVGDGTLHYLGGAVKRCDPVYVDLVNHKDLETLGKDVGYLKFGADCNSSELSLLF
ncbi:hypothetical protein PIB30_050197 [Stylosanthes scabra]|uniref:PB1-like domain-containing protein n=1 Tax=Stylosanthes scabra TaxID=79078 RepID=A0ABU6UKD4_9FABA|nr:hypothetical protein [Stylosanthes scabra]